MVELIIIVISCSAGILGGSWISAVFAATALTLCSLTQTMTLVRSKQAAAKVVIGLNSLHCAINALFVATAAYLIGVLVSTLAT